MRKEEIGEEEKMRGRENRRREQKIGDRSGEEKSIV
jgi:hypothetical protein